MSDELLSQLEDSESPSSSAASEGYVEWLAPGEHIVPFNTEAIATRIVDALRPTRLGLGALLAKLEKLCRVAALTVESRNVLLASLLSDDLELQVPIPVHIERDEFQYIASSKDIGVFGVGVDEDVALDDLRLAIVEFYHDLKNEPLGEHLRQRYAYLSSIVREKK